MQTLRLYRYLVLDEQNELQRDRILASSHDHAKAKLLAQSLTPLKITRSSHLRLRWKKQDIIYFFEQLATLLNAGLPLLKSLRLFSEEHPLSHWRVLTHQLQKTISHGHALSESLADYPQIFSLSISNTLKTAEITGELAICCQAIAKLLAQQQLLRSNINKALRYPLILLFVMLIVITVMLLGVLPQFATLYANVAAQLPWLTQALLDLSDWLQKQGVLLGIGSALSSLIALFSWQYHNSQIYRAKIETLFLLLPLIGPLIKHANLSQIFHHLHLTQQAGLPLLDGLENVSTITVNIRYQQALRSIYQQIQQGESFSQSLQLSPLFPALCLQLIRVGEESGALDSLLLKLAKHYQHQVEHMSEFLAQSLEPIMMAIMGIMVGGLVLAMYLPIFQLGQVLSG